MYVLLYRPETSKNWKVVTESEKSETVPTETPADTGAIPFLNVDVKNTDSDHI